MPSINVGPRRPSRTITPSFSARDVEINAPEMRRRAVLTHLAGVSAYPRAQEMRYLANLLRAPGGDAVVRQELRLLKEARSMGILPERVEARAALIAEAKHRVDAGQVDELAHSAVTEDGDLIWSVGEGTGVRILYRDGCEDYRNVSGELHRRGGPAERSPAGAAWYESGRRVHPDGSVYAWAA